MDKFENARKELVQVHAELSTHKINVNQRHNESMTNAPAGATNLIAKDSNSRSKPNIPPKLSKLAGNDFIDITYTNVNANDTPTIPVSKSIPIPPELEPFTIVYQDDHEHEHELHDIHGHHHHEQGGDREVGRSAYNYGYGFGNREHDHSHDVESPIPSYDHENEQPDCFKLASSKQNIFNTNNTNATTKVHGNTNGNRNINSDTRDQHKKSHSKRGGTRTRKTSNSQSGFRSRGHGNRYERNDKHNKYNNRYDRSDRRDRYYDKYGIEHSPYKKNTNINLSNGYPNTHEIARQHGYNYSTTSDFESKYMPKGRDRRIGDNNRYHSAHNLFKDVDFHNNHNNHNNHTNIKHSHSHINRYDSPATRTPTQLKNRYKHKKAQTPQASSTRRTLVKISPEERIGTPPAMRQSPTISRRTRLRSRGNGFMLSNQNTQKNQSNQNNHKNHNNHAIRRNDHNESGEFFFNKMINNNNMQTNVNVNNVNGNDKVQHDGQSRRPKPLELRLGLQEDVPGEGQKEPQDQQRQQKVRQKIKQQPKTPHPKPSHQSTIKSLPNMYPNKPKSQPPKSDNERDSIESKTNRDKRQVNNDNHNEINDENSNYNTHHHGLSLPRANTNVIRNRSQRQNKIRRKSHNSRAQTESKRKRSRHIKQMQHMRNQTLNSSGIDLTANLNVNHHGSIDKNEKIGVVTNTNIIKDAITNNFNNVNDNTNKDSNQPSQILQEMEHKESNSKTNISKLSKIGHASSRDTLNKVERVASTSNIDSAALSSDFQRFETTRIHHSIHSLLHQNTARTNRSSSLKSSLKGKRFLSANSESELSSCSDSSGGSGGSSSSTETIYTGDDITSPPFAPKIEDINSNDKASMSGLTDVTFSKLIAQTNKNKNVNLNKNINQIQSITEINRNSINDIGINIGQSIDIVCTDIQDNDHVDVDDDEEHDGDTKIESVSKQNLSIQGINLTGKASDDILTKS